MIDLKDFKEKLETSGFPVSYREFPEGSAPSMPFICYLIPGTSNFAADGVAYYGVHEINVELYTKHKDLNAEGKVEQALSSFFWNKTETYIENEECFCIRYELEV